MVKLLLTVMLGLLGMTSVMAQESAPAAAVAPAPIADAPAVPEASAPVDAAQTAPASKPVMEPLPEDGLVSLDFQDADIRNVLKVLSYKSGVNIVTGPEVTGVVTIQLTDVPWQKALDVILSTYGYGFERKGNIILVTTVENLKKRREDNLLLEEQEPLVTKTYPLSFAKAADILDSINKIKSPRGSINFDQRTNSLIVRDVQSSLELIDSVIATLDSVTPQIMIEAKIVETNLTDEENLGIDWTTSVKATGGIQPTSFPFTQKKNQYIPSPTYGPAVSELDDPKMVGQDKAFFTYGTLDTSGLSATLNLLKSRNNINILSNPSIVTLDNATAKIVVATQYPFPQYTYNQDQAKMQISGWDYKDIGIIFEVTPHVNNENLVTLDLKPTVTTIIDFAALDPAATFKVPILSSEEARTKVMVKNGQTLVIAGLIKNKSTTIDNKVPFLGDIPFIGQAFKKKGDKQEKTELLVFLTPRIVTTESPSSTVGAPTGSMITEPKVEAPATK